MPRGSQASQDIESLQHILGLPWGLFLLGNTQNTSTRRHPGGILTNWLIHAETVGLHWVPLRLSLPSHFHTLPLRVYPDTLQRKLILAAWIHNLVLSATTVQTINLFMEHELIIWELCPQAQLSLHHDRTWVQQLYYCCHCTDPPIHLYLTKVCNRLFIKTIKNHINLWKMGIRWPI